MDEALQRGHGSHSLTTCRELAISNCKVPYEAVHRVLSELLLRELVATGYGGVVVFDENDVSNLHVSSWTYPLLPFL